MISDYLDNDLPPDWRENIDTHLNACDGCTTYLDQIRQTIIVLEQTAPPRRPMAH
jgi:anti-sigma factor RsiW